MQVLVTHQQDSGQRATKFAASYPPECPFRALLALRGAIADATGLADDDIYTLPEPLAGALDLFPPPTGGDVATDADSNIFLLDVGGTTSDSQVFHISADGSFNVVSTGSVHLGGEDLARSLCEKKCILRSRGRGAAAAPGQRASLSEVQRFIRTQMSNRDLTAMMESAADANPLKPGWKRCGMPEGGNVNRNWWVHGATLVAIVHRWAAEILIQACATSQVCTCLRSIASQLPSCQSLHATAASTLRAECGTA